MLSQKIKAFLREGHRERARKAGKEVIGRLKEGWLREASGTIWGWHKMLESKAAKPCFRTMEYQTQGREDLYGFQQPPGEKIPQNGERALDELRRAAKNMASTISISTIPALIPSKEAL